jgi:mannosyltransferase OCH1-like enzyme
MNNNIFYFICFLVIVFYFNYFNESFTSNNNIYKLDHFYSNKDINYQTIRVYNNIPLKAFTCWHTKDVLYHMYNTVLKNISNNPEIDFYIYDNNESIDFINTHFNDDVLSAYNRLIPESYKSDLLRYCLLYINGGIYFDIKFLFNVPIIKLIAKYQSIFVKDFNHCYNATANGFIITDAKNPIFLDCINQIIYNINNNIYGDNSLFPTGPCLLGDITSKYNIDFKLKMYKLFNTDDNITVKNNYKLFDKSENNEGEQYYISDYNDKEALIIVYPEYRSEQKILQNNPHYSKLWDNKNIYIN